MADANRLRASDTAEPVFYDFDFRVQRKNGTCKKIPTPTPPLEAPIADTHCHLGSLAHADLALARAAAHNVDFICDIVDATESAERERIALWGWQADAEALLSKLTSEKGLHVPKVRMACGVHPHRAALYTKEVEEHLLALLQDPRMCCLGEVGLDYYYDLSPRNIQQQVFRRQIQLAHRTGLVLSLHIRGAHEDALRILDEEGFPAAGTVLHCCSLPPCDLRPWIERGCYIAYGGMLTFKKLDEARCGARIVPTNKLLLETDAPYMAPVPLRGVENGPECMIFTAAKLAEICGIEPGRARCDFLQQIHDTSVRLLDRKQTVWQCEGR